MEWLQSIFGEGNNGAMQLVIMTLALVAVVALVVWLFKWLAGFSNRRAHRGSKPRLSVIDVAAVDDKRHLVLVRRDNVEHLVMVGGGSDVLIEAGIEAAAKASASTTTTTEDASSSVSAPEDDTKKRVDPQNSVTTGGKIAGTAVAAADTAKESVSSSAQSIQEMLDTKREEKTIPTGTQASENKFEPAVVTKDRDSAEIKTEAPAADVKEKPASDPSIDDILSQLRQADKK